MKICIQCKIEKEVVGYYKCNNAKDGHRNTCIACTMNNSKERYKRLLDTSNERICKDCNITKPITDFKKEGRGYSNSCKLCIYGERATNNNWPSEKKCSCCLEIKPIERFPKKGKHTNGTKYYTNVCKPCDNKNRNLRRAGKPKMKSKLQRNRIKRKYGLTMEEVNQMIVNQESKCKICTKVFEKLVIDHNHSTGKVRGLLCPKCNSGLGMFDDNIENLKQAIIYLENSTILS